MSKTLLYGATKVDENNAAYAAAASLEPFQWKNRVFVIFGDTDNSRASRQENLVLADKPGLSERDMIVLKAGSMPLRVLFGQVPVSIDADALRRELAGPQAGEFAAVLVGKDGTVKLRVSEPVSPGELFAIIDSMPMRAAEALKQDL